MTLCTLLVELWPSYTFLLLVPYHSFSTAWKKGQALSSEEKRQLYFSKENSSRMIPFWGENIAIILSNSMEIKNLKGWSEKGAGTVVRTRDDAISAHKLI